MNTVRLICFIIGIIFGVILCLYPLIARKRSDAPGWTRTLVALLGVSGLCWAVLGLSAFSLSSHLSAHGLHMLQHYRALCGGVGIGLFLAWCVSGEFGRACKRRSHVGT